jgi:hypothetical protein
MKVKQYLRKHDMSVFCNMFLPGNKAFPVIADDLAQAPRPIWTHIGLTHMGVALLEIQ